jgi:hypothetical protein
MLHVVTVSVLKQNESMYSQGNKTHHNKILVNDDYAKAVLRIRIRDPKSGDFLPPGSGMNFFRIPDPGSKEHVFGEIFLRILVLQFFY